MARNTGGASYKTGLVVESKPGFARVQFPDLDGLVSDWLPTAQRKTSGDRDVSTLDKGTQVGCLLDEHFESGIVVGAVYSDADLSPTASGDVHHIAFSDGSFVEYDRAGHMLTAKVGGCTVTVTGTGIKVTGGDVEADAVSLKKHLHQDVSPGDGVSGKPVGGSDGGGGDAAAVGAELRGIYDDA